MLRLTHNCWQILQEIKTVNTVQEMQNSTKILIFSTCICIKPFQHKSDFGNILMLKTRNFSLRVLSTARKHFETNWAFDEYANLY